MAGRELSDSQRSAIDAAFAAAFPKGHGQCVDDCRQSYWDCQAAGYSWCRDNLEKCINGCPDGESVDAEALNTLLDTLDRVTG